MASLSERSGRSARRRKSIIEERDCTIQKTSGDIQETIRKTPRKTERCRASTRHLPGYDLQSK
jgi:hypothetical protein